jgi:hypothetical protein
MRVALRGGFDAADAELLAARRVLEIGLERRLPGCEVTAFSPEGRLLALDGGRPAQALPGSPEGLATLAAHFECVMALGGPETELETSLPTVRADEPLPGDGESGELPPLPLLLPGLLGPELLRRRTDFLRLVGWAWPPGRVLTVQGDATLLGAAGEIAAALLPLIESGTASVQLAASGGERGEERFAGALESALGGRCRRIPEVAAVEDQVALVGGSTAYLGPPGLGLWAAVALGVPSAVPATSAPGDLDRLLTELGISRPAPGELAAVLLTLLAGGAEPPRAGAALDRLERHLDGLAGLVLAAADRARPASEPPGGATDLTTEARLEALRVAHQARGRQLFAERRAAQAALDATAAGLTASLAEARAEADGLRAELAAARAANDAMVASRTWRYTQSVRDGLAWVRERRR